MKSLFLPTKEQMAESRKRGQRRFVREQRETLTCECGRKVKGIGPMILHKMSHKQ